MKKKIRVIIKNPGCKPYGTSIEPTEESIRKKLSGEYKRLRFMEDGCIICRQDIAGLDYNCEYCGRDFYGPMIWVGYAEDAFLPFPVEFNTFKKLNGSLFEEFEKGEEERRRRIGQITGLGICAGLWGWLGYELMRQIIEIL